MLIDQSTKKKIGKASYFKKEMSTKIAEKFHKIL